jgi:hypothetical protein
MSVASMTNVAFNRRADQQAVIKGAPRSTREIARSTAENPAGQTAATSTLASIAAYIPTEILTVYVAVIAALAGSATTTTTGWIAFWFFFISTPIVVWLTYAAKVRQATGDVPVNPREWPVWEMIAATLAYLAWAFALPATPFAALSFYSPAIAGVIVLVVTTGLALIAPVVQQPIQGARAVDEGAG